MESFDVSVLVELQLAISVRCIKRDYVKTS